MRINSISLLLFVLHQLNIKFFTAIFACFLSFGIFGQTIHVDGTIFEDSTSRVIPYAKVFFMGTQNGTVSDINGSFNIKIQSKNLKYDTIIVSLLGYTTQKIPISRSSENHLMIHLSSSLFQDLDEVTAVAGENPAWRYMRKLILNKDKNNPNNIDYYSNQEYAKIRFDLNNFTDKIKTNLLMRPFDYIWDNAQETDDGVAFLPVLLTEKSIQHYYRKKPNDKKDIIHGEKTTGLAGPKLLNFTEDLYITPNIYDNYIEILGKSFPSPLNDNYKSNYKFYLLDSTYQNGKKTYAIRFIPKHERILAFSGEMSIDSSTFAVTQIQMRFDIKANVNFVRSYIINQFYEEVAPNTWMISEAQVIGDFTVVENATDMTGFFGRKRAFYSNYSIGEEINTTIFDGLETIQYDDNAKTRDSLFWIEMRSEELNQEEISLLKVTKRVEKDPAFILRKKMFYTIGTGYIPFNKIQMGDIYTFYSYNHIEHSRVKFGGRTNPDNVFPLHASTYIAYGTFDQKWKYSVATYLNLSKKLKTRIGGSYKYDIEQLGRSFNHISLDHILGSLTQINPSNSRNYVTRFEAYVEKEFFKGFISRLTYFNTNYSPTKDNQYINIQNGPVEVSKYQSSGLRLNLKFSYLFDDISGKFYDKKDLYRPKRKFPDISFSYEFSAKKTFASDFDYQKIKLSIRQRLNAKKFGYFTYNFDGGKTFGTVPFTFLDIPFGNQLIFADQYAFNLMDFMEFASDEYVAIHLSHHFQGFILDRIPLINKLKFRSYIFGKSFFGQLSSENNQLSHLFPTGLRAINKPYHEVGFGIENIFKFASVDFVWRLTPGIGEYYTFMVKPSFKFSF